MKTADRFKGSLLGLATGDALGTTLEFESPGSFTPIDDIVGGGPFRLKPGEWTDDTSMALCLAESLIESSGFDASDQMERYLKWYRTGYLSSNGFCFDIGNATRTALEKYKSTGNPFSGAADPHTAGNGSIMRLAPVPLYYANDPALAMKYCSDSSRTTHGAVECIDACRYFGALLIGAVKGESKDTLLSGLYHPLQGYWRDNPLTPKIKEIAEGSFKRKSPPAIKGTGYVVDSLEAALWAFYKSDNFRDGALLAVNLGNDADTTGAVYGQLAGAFYSIEGIPDAWQKLIKFNSLIIKMASQLHKKSCLL